MYAQLVAKSHFFFSNHLRSIIDVKCKRLNDRENYTHFENFKMKQTRREDLIDDNILVKETRRNSYWINLLLWRTSITTKVDSAWTISYGRPSTITPIVAERMGRDMKTRSPRLGYRPYNPYVDRHTNETSKRT